MVKMRAINLLGWVLTFLGLLLTNEIARRSKAGGVFFFAVLPIVLGIYFIAIEIAANQGAEWALSNQTYLYMNDWFHYAKLYDAAAGSGGVVLDLFPKTRLLSKTLSTCFLIPIKVIK